MLQNILPPLFTGDLKDGTFDHTQHLLGAVFNGDKGAMGQLYAQQRHRVFWEVQNELAGRNPTPNLRAFVFPDADGLCCMVTCEVVGKEIVVTCNSGLDFFVAQNDSKAPSLMYHYKEGNDSVLTIDPEIGGCFSDNPNLLEPEKADPKFIAALSRLGAAPERVGIGIAPQLTELMGAQPIRTVALKPRKYGSLLTVGRG